MKSYADIMEEERLNKVKAEIAYAKKLTKEMNDEAVKYNRLYKIALKDEIYTVRNMIRDNFVIHIANSAREWLKCVNDEKYKSGFLHEDLEKLEGSFGALVHYIEENVTSGDKVTVTEIMGYGFSAEAYHIVFTTDKGEFELTFPCIGRLTEENYSYLCEGKVNFVHRKSGTKKGEWVDSDWLAASYFIEDINSAYNNFNKKVE